MRVHAGDLGIHLGCCARDRIAGNAEGCWAHPNLRSALYSGISVAPSGLAFRVSGL